MQSGTIHAKGIGIFAGAIDTDIGVSVQKEGTILSDGDGIWAGSDGGGDILITLNWLQGAFEEIDAGRAGMRIVGLKDVTTIVSALNEGLEFAVGGANTLTVHRTVNLSGASFDILGGTGNETVQNYGNLSTPGKVDLGTGDNYFNNRPGATFNAGEIVDLGEDKISDLVTVLIDGDGFVIKPWLAGDAGETKDLPGNLFINAGDFSPGGIEETTVFVKDKETILAEWAGDSDRVPTGEDVVFQRGIQTTQLTGNFVQTDSGTFTVNIDPETGQSDRLEIIGGSATLDGRLLVIPAKPVVDDPNRYVILTTDGGAITGTFRDTETLFLIPLFSSYEADYSVENEVAAVFREAPTYEQVAVKKNHKSLTRHGLSTLPGDNSVITYLHRIVEETDALAAYDALTGEVHSSVSGLLMQDSFLRSDAVVQRLHRLADREEHTSYGLLTDAQAAGEGALAALGPNDWWIEVHGSVLEQDANSDIGTAEVDHDASGFLIGADHSNDGWAIGVAFGQTQGETDIDDRLSDADTQTWSFGMYGSGRVEAAQDLPLHISFGAFGNWHEIKTSRTVAFDDFHEELEADYDATSFQAFAEIGTHVDVTDDLFVHPFASVSHISMETDGFTETAVGDSTEDAALTADDSSQSLTTTTLGLRSGIMVDRLNLHGMIGWRHGFGDVEPETELSFAGSDKFTITGSPIAEDALITEFSIGTDLAPGISFAAIYRGQLAEESQSHSLNASLSGRF
jgi:outer membrane autotransporter protein